MNILYLGPHYFRKELSEQGHRVVSVGITDGNEIVLSLADYAFDKIVERLDPSWKPDICLLVEELSERHFPGKVELRPCPLIYYSIDTHLSRHWLPHFARACDGLIISHQDDIQLYKEFSRNTFWLPWSIDPAEYFYVEAKKEYDVAFVGVIDSNRLKRKQLLDHLDRHFKVKVLSPSIETPWIPAHEIRSLFHESRIVINESISMELNFRIFEAMAAGAMLVTEKIEDGLPELFEDGKELVTYTCGDVLEKIGYYLASPCERERIAGAGRMAVERKHTRSVRAGQLAGILQSLLDPGWVLNAGTENDLGRSRYFWGIRSGNGDGDLEEAARLYRVAADRIESRAEALQNLGELHSFQGNPDAAIDAYGGSLEMGRMNFRLGGQLGTLLLEQGRIEEAREAFMRICSVEMPE